MNSKMLACVLLGGLGPVLAFGQANSSGGVKHHLKTVIDATAPISVTAAQNLLNQGTVSSPFVFGAGNTYFIGQNVNFTANVTLEGNSVIKMADGVSMTFSGDVLCLADDYNPATITSCSDNTIGTTIVACDSPTLLSNGAAIYLTASGKTAELHNLHIRYVCKAIVSDRPLAIEDVQFAHCCTALTLNNKTGIVQNVLMFDVDSGFSGHNYNVTVEHLTMDKALSVASSTGGNSSISVVNSIFTEIKTNGWAGWNAMTHMADSSAYPTGTNVIYQVVGAGLHYLAANSPYRKAGSTNISANLAASLVNLTTWPPQVHSNILVDVDTVLGPGAPRDTNAAPDLGYHYSPLDHLLYNYAVTNATLGIRDGTAIAFTHDPGIWLADGASIQCVGQPLAPNHLVGYEAVQEEALFLGTGNGLHVNPYRIGTEGAPARFRFTEFGMNSCRGVPGTVFYCSENWGYSSLDILDCRFLGAGVWTLLGNVDSTISLDNNLLENQAINCEIPIAAHNNLFRRSTAIFAQSEDGGTTLQDNLFDSSEIQDASLSDTNLVAITHDHNGYLFTSTNHLPAAASDIMLNAFQYGVGPQGIYYQVSTNLIDQGSRSASDAGLTDFTVNTNEASEAESTVDIGCHYTTSQVQPDDQSSSSLSLRSTMRSGLNLSSLMMSANSHGSDPTWLLDIDFGGADQADQEAGYAAIGQNDSDYWNFISSSGTHSNLLLADSETTGVSASIGFNWTWGLGETVTDVMYNGFACSSSAINVEIAGLPAGTYDIYVYGHANNGSPDNGVFRLTCGNVDYGTNSTTSTDDSYLDSTWEEGSQYVVFSDVIVESGQSVSLTSLVNNGYGQAIIAGMQIASWTGINDDTAPSITANPTGLSLSAGSSGTLTVGASGSSPLYYQWRLNGSPISGATSSSYTINNFQSSQAGSYDVVVSNAYGTNTSQSATVSMLSSSDIQINIDFGGADQTARENGYAAIGQSANDYWNFVSGVQLSASLFDANSNATSVSVLHSSVGGAYGINVSDTMYQGYLYNYNGNINVTVSNLPAGTYQFYVYGHDNNDSGSNGIYTLTCNGVNYGTKATGTTSGDYTQATWQEGLQYVIYTSIVVPANQTVSLMCLPNSHNQSVISGMQITASSSSGTLPTITSQPSSQVVTQGDSTTFSAAASGNPNPTYQWYSNEVAISGATSSTLTLNNVQPSADQSTYYVVAHNDIGNTTSSVVTLTVRYRPIFTSQPSSLTVTQGNSATFSVTAGGNPSSITYQWYSNGVALGWSASSTLTLNNVQPSADQSTYYVVAHNDIENTTSSVVTLTVRYRPIFTSQPSSLTVTQGNSATFSVTAGGNPNPTYLWYSNGGGPQLGDIKHIDTKQRATQRRPEHLLCCRSQ